MLSTSATGAFAQAFGIAMGTPIENLEIEKDHGSSTYTISVPKPHSEFETYLVLATPQTGVCKINAIGKDHNNDRFGTSVKNAFSELHSALESRYGTHKFYDFIAPGGIWDGPEEWVMSIRQSERYYDAFWDEEEKSSLPEEFQGITLGVRANSSDSAYISLSYTYSNFDECYRILNEANTDGL